MTKQETTMIRAMLEYVARHLETAIGPGNFHFGERDQIVQDGITRLRAIERIIGTGIDQGGIDEAIQNRRRTAG